MTFAQDERRSVEMRPEPFRHRSTITDLPASAPGAVLPMQLMSLQRAVGNRATSALVALQRCGDTPPDQCSCHDGDDGDHASAESGPTPPAHSAVAPTG